jgi:hypothetical protein
MHLLLVLAAQLVVATPSQAAFDPAKDVIALHYDHAPDLDDGQSAAADRTLLQSKFGARWLEPHLVIVSGTYGINAPTFVRKSDEVMNAVWDDWWLSAHDRWKPSVERVAQRWVSTIERGGRVWVKEGGQSDFTTDVVTRIKEMRPAIDTRKSIVVVQHSSWNEERSTPKKLAYSKANTTYLKIPDANAHDALPVGAPSAKTFVDAALANRTYGKYWRAAFAYYPPLEPRTGHLDFSDTGELTHILGLGEVDVATFRSRYLSGGK